MENTQNQGRIPNMMCFPDLLFYDAEQRFLVSTTTSKSYLTMIQISIWLQWKIISLWSYQSMFL